MAAENVKATAILENSLAVSYKMNHAITIQSSNYTLGHFPREMKICVHTKISM